MNDQHRLLGYLFSTDDMKRLRAVEKGLYGDGSILTADARRDLANLLNVTLSGAEEVPVTEDSPFRPDHCPCGLPWDDCPVNNALNKAVAAAVNSGCKQVSAGAAL